MAVPDFVVDSDGVPIAVFVEGVGPPLLMVHGSVADHTAFDALVREVSPSLTTFRMDRRGFGASGDGDDYTIEREYADVAAVVAAVADRTGVPVAVFGHSYGANCALGGAATADEVSHLVLYEPSFGLRYPEGSIESIEAALGRGDAETAITELFSRILGMTPAEIDEVRRSPLWADRVRDAHTIPRECRVEQDRSFASARWSAGCRTWVLSGGATTADLAGIARLAAKAIDRAELHVLDGLGHLGPRLAPDRVSAQLFGFLGVG